MERFVRVEEPLVESQSSKLFKYDPHRGVRSLRLKYLLFAFSILTSHNSEAMLALLRIVPIVAPIVPDAQRNIVSYVGQEHPSQVFGLRFLSAAFVFSEAGPRR